MVTISVAFIDIKLSSYFKLNRTQVQWIPDSEWNLYLKKNKIAIFAPIFS